MYLVSLTQVGSPLKRKKASVSRGVLIYNISIYSSNDSVMTIRSSRFSGEEFIELQKSYQKDS